MGRVRWAVAMHVIEAFDEPVRAVAVSPDGRFVAAAAGTHLRLSVRHWLSGAEVFRLNRQLLGGAYSYGVEQLAFTADGGWLVFRAGGWLERVNPLTGGG